MGVNNDVSLRQLEKHLDCLLFFLFSSTINNLPFQSSKFNY